MLEPRAPASVIVPTFREAPNLSELVRRMFAACEAAGRPIELIIVDDDSQDGTEDVVSSLAEGFPVRLVIRRDERGLSGAVLRGFAEARHDQFLVMDADLQHPPELVPVLLEKLESSGADFVLASRYSGEGTIAVQWPLGRRLASKLATALARPLTPLSDPMSGFFALRRETWQRASRLNPIGYKIGLELFVKCRCSSAAEVPIEFGTRAAGDSKANVRQFIQYLRHLWGLYWFRFPVALGVISVVLLALIVALLSQVAFSRP